MKYRDNMSAEEIAAFKEEIDALDAAYASATEDDAKNPMPEWEDQSDYVGMGWIDSRGRP